MTYYLYYFFAASIMTVLLNLWLRNTFRWWTIFFIAIIPTLVLGMIAIYIIALLEYGELNTTLNSNILAAQLGQSLGSQIIAFVLISPFFKYLEKRNSTQEKSKIKMNFALLSPIKKLPLGIYRLIIVGWFILPLLLSSISASFAKYDTDEIFFSTWFVSIIIYYVLIRLSLWVYLGFKNDNK